MTNQEKLEMNMAAAKLLGYLHIDWDADNALDKLCVVSMDDKEWVAFDIFTNPSQCLDVVKKLGEFGVGVHPMDNSGNVRWVVIGECIVDTVSFFMTYEQAVGAACLELMK